ncbi:hypothetical protein JDN40_01935 [Rhodomicrobium vannielii ATCC 17100]|nr:hypothetical protein [Rhodomicrobium vannielii]MBJ7532876.1 hypothetical protein [Rhodomicrobium vannielii ATCC 17100]
MSFYALGSAVPVLLVSIATGDLAAQALVVFGLYAFLLVSTIVAAG